jgi:prepilin-type N-terminal cleavage/methylation domain-containing protein
VKNQRGFTLLEVLIAVVIIAFAFVALLGLHARGVWMVIRDQNMTRATLVAREVISTVEYTVATRGLQGLSNTQGASEAYPEFRYQVEVNPTELEEVRMIIVSIAWDDVTPPTQVIYYVREQGGPA